MLVFVCFVLSSSALPSQHQLVLCLALASTPPAPLGDTYFFSGERTDRGRWRRGGVFSAAAEVSQVG